MNVTSTKGNRGHSLLVVGGSGFIGRWVVQGGIERGYKVSSLSLNVPKTENQIPEVEYLAANMGDRDKLSCRLKGTNFTHVINLGGYIDHSAFDNGGREMIDVHFSGVLNLVDALSHEHLEGFVQIGSSDEYGNASPPQKESQLVRPISCYSLAKCAATEFLQMLNSTGGFPATIVRLFLVYGPGQDQKRFLPQIISGCLQGKSFPTSAGEQLRDFCYIEDVVAGLFSALEAKSARGEVFNIASGNPVSIRSVIERIATLLGKGEPLFGEFPYRKGENMALYADVSKASRLLAWEATTGFDEGLSRTIDSYRSEMFS